MGDPVRGEPMLGEEGAVETRWEVGREVGRIIAN